MATFPVTLRAALSGHTLAEVEVYADDTLQALRAAVHSQEGGCMLRCDFLFGGKVLLEHELLGNAGVQPGGVVDVLRSPGPWLAAACADGAARLWDLSSGDCFKTLQGNGAGLRKVVLLADQQHVLTGSDDGTAILWNLGGAGHRTLADHGACVTEVSASPDSSLVLTIAHGELRVFRTGSGECIWALDDEYILHACFAPNSAEVLVASSTQLRLWCLKELRESARLQGHGAAVLAATYSRDGRLILSASIDRTARVWDAKSGACLHILSGHLDSVRALSVSASGELLATASGITARVWSSATGACERTINSHPGTIYALQFSADARILLVAFGCGREVFAGPANSGVKLWCTRSAECMVTLLPGGLVIAAALLSDASRVVTACSDRAELWDAATGDRLLRTRDQWLDWALPGPIYSRVTGKAPGSSRKIGLVDDEDDGDVSEDEEAGKANCNAMKCPAFLKFADPPSEVEKRLLRRQFFPSKVGGRPAWLIPANLPGEEELACLRCSSRMRFLMQIYASQGMRKESCFHRTLHIFVCTNCQPNEVRVFRAQLPRDCPYYSYDEPDREAAIQNEPLPDAELEALCCPHCGLASGKAPELCSDCDRRARNGDPPVPFAEFEAWVGSPFTGKVVIRRDINRVEHLAVLCEAVTARYGQEAEILDDGRTIFVSLDDEIAFGVVPRPNMAPLAVNVWRLASKRKAASQSLRKPKETKAKATEKPSKQREVAPQKGAKWQAKNKAEAPAPAPASNGKAPLRMLGLVQRPNKKTGRYQVICQDISDVYGQDAEIAAEEVPDDLKPGDRVSFTVEEPKHNAATIWARNVKVLAARGVKRHRPVTAGDGEELDGLEELEVQECDGPSLFMAEEPAPPAEEEALLDFQGGLYDDDPIADSIEFLQAEQCPETPTPKPPSTPEEWQLAQARLFGALPPLKPNWIRIRAKSTGKVYYYNMVSGHSTADISVSAANVSDDEEEEPATIETSAAERRAEEDGNNPDAYAAAVQETADAVQGIQVTDRDKKDTDALAKLKAYQEMVREDPEAALDKFGASFASEWVEEHSVKDPVFARFQRFHEENKSHVLRYHLQGVPRWFCRHRQLEGEAPMCHCGGSRIFECQVQPMIISLLAGDEPLVSWVTGIFFEPPEFCKDRRRAKLGSYLRLKSAGASAVTVPGLFKIFKNSDCTYQFENPDLWEMFLDADALAKATAKALSYKLIVKFQPFLQRAVAVQARPCKIAWTSARSVSTLVRKAAMILSDHMSRSLPTCSPNLFRSGSRRDKADQVLLQEEFAYFVDHQGELAPRAEVQGITRTEHAGR
ncbi:HET-E1 [Symbiodinium necroappetens]|uniref:HET-E1 protein n=1 Tax=Symbiodinium necroappetens TaxID=1628268 RepID=A0A812VYQ4_9DINO|nr:HET-E1 [Symbiodinium necroappetens]